MAGAPTGTPDVARAEQSARALLARYRIGYAAQVELELLAWDLGALVYRAALEGAAARLLRVGRKAVITLSDRPASVARQRFTVAHEVGHFLLHTAADDQLAMVIDTRLEHDDDRAIEREANAFAGELLMPAERWREHATAAPPGLDAVRALLDTYGVGLLAAAIRLVELSPARRAVAYCREGKLVWAAHSPSFGFTLERGTAVDRDTHAARVMRGSGEAFLQGVAPEAWLKDAPVSGLAMKEHCVPVPSQSASLSMLCIEG